MITAILAVTLVTAAQQAARAIDSVSLPAPRLEYAEPPFDVPAELRDSIRFAWLTVPQDHNDTTAGTLRLAVSIAAPRTRDPAPEPIVLIPGGPGQASVAPFTVSVAQSVRLAPYREHRAIVLLDPRGHGLSEPSACPELNGAAPLDENDAAAEETLRQKLTDCRQRLDARGVRLQTLSAVQVAYDLDLLRRALDVPQLNLVGASYGSRIVAEAIRTVPFAIRAAHMDGPVPPALPHLTVDEARTREVMSALFRRCAEQEECRAAFPNLPAEYDSVLARVAERPLQVPMARSDRAPSGAIVVDRELLRIGLAQLGLNRQLAAAAPLLIHTLANQGLDLLAVMAPQLVRLTVEDVGFIAQQAFLCNDSPRSLEQVASLPSRCPVLVGERYGDTVAVPLMSDVPVLIATGEFDPRTPPFFARFAAQGLTRAHVVVVPWVGHDALPPCLVRMASEFFDNPERAPDVACVDSTPAVRFATDVVPSRWVANTVAQAATRPSLTGSAAAVVVAMLLVGVVGLPVRALRRGPAVDPRRPAPSIVSSWLLALAGLVMVGGLAAAVFAGAAVTPLLPGIGVPRAWAWVLGMPWLLLALFVVALVLNIRAANSVAPSWLRSSGVVGAGLLLAFWLAASRF